MSRFFDDFERADLADARREAAHEAAMEQRWHLLQDDFRDFFVDTNPADYLKHDMTAEEIGEAIVAKWEEWRVE